MTERTPDQKYGTHLARRLLESYDGSGAGVRGAPITLAEADAYIEGLVAQLEAGITLQLRARFVHETADKCSREFHGGTICETCFSAALREGR